MYGPRKDLSAWGNPDPKANFTCSLLLEAPNSISLEMSTEPGVTTEIGKIKWDHCQMRGWWRDTSDLIPEGTMQAFKQLWYYESYQCPPWLENPKGHVSVVTPTLYLYLRSTWQEENHTGDLARKAMATRGESTTTPLLKPTWFLNNNLLTVCSYTHRWE